MRSISGTFLLKSRRHKESAPLLFNIDLEGLANASKKKLFIEHFHGADSGQTVVWGLGNMKSRNSHNLPDNPVRWCREPTLKTGSWGHREHNLPKATQLPSQWGRKETQVAVAPEPTLQLRLCVAWKCTAKAGRGPPDTAGSTVAGQPKEGGGLKCCWKGRCSGVADYKIT